jgi:YD repeat-containing protein
MTMTGPLSTQVVAVSDIDTSLVRSVTDALGRKTSYDYDSNRRLTKVTLPEGNEVRYLHDLRGNVTETRLRDKNGTSASDIVTSASFDASCANPKVCNKPIATTDARGATTDYTYDSGHGGLLTATAPAPSAGAVRPQTRITYAPFQAYYQNSPGNIVASGSNITLPVATSVCQTGSSCAGTADEAKTTVSYGPQTAGVANNLLPVSTSSGDGTGALTAATAMSYDAVGNLLTVDGPLAGSADSSRARYDAARRAVGSVSPDPDGAGPLKHRARRVTLDGDGQPTKVESGTVNSQSDADWASFAPLEAMETAYDAHARPVVQKLVAGGTTHALSQVSYDALGRPECTAQRMNPSAFSSLPASACSPGTAGSFGPDRISKAIHDELGRVKEVRTAVGTAEEAAEARYTFRPNGQVETVTDAENNVTTFAYDGHDRPKSTNYPATAQHGATTETLTYESVNGGTQNSPLVSAFTNRAGQTIAFSHDALGRTTFKDLPNTIVQEADVGYGYDNLGRLTLANDSRGRSNGFSYDALGRTTQATGTLGTLSYAYDLAGRRTRITHPDGFFADYDHLLTGEVSAVRENGATSGVGVLASFAYDDLGRRTSLTRGNGTVTSYGYDAASRLGSLTQDLAGTGGDLTLGFAYNPAGQIVTNTRSNDLYSWAGATTGTVTTPANPLNQAVSAGGTALTYDAKGNLTWDGTRSYGYTAENKLTAVQGGNLGYDPLGRRGHHRPPLPPRRRTRQHHRGDGLRRHNDRHQPLRRIRHPRRRQCRPLPVYGPDVAAGPGHVQLQGAHLRAEPRALPAAGPDRLWRRDEPVRLRRRRSGEPRRLEWLEG